MKRSTFQDALLAALRGFPLTLANEQLALLEEHWRLVRAWNARTNLTAVSDDAQAAVVHYRDSLEALRVLPAGPTVDLGSGAGYPGVPIAIAEPGRPVTLVEPRAKRASFLKVATARLNLRNVQVLQRSSRGEPDRPYCAGVTRATFSSPVELTDCLRWLEPHGLLIAFRTTATAEPGSTIHAYDLGGERRVLEMWRHE